MDWRPIKTAVDQWIIGYTSWGKEGRVHQWVGPCERYKDHYEFVNHDFDMFPEPTHWQPFPEPPALNADKRE